MGGRNTHHKTTSTISRGWYFTTKSGGVWLFPYPVAQQARAVVRAVSLVRSRATIGGADDGIRRAEDLALRLHVIIPVNDMEGRPQLIRQDSCVLSHGCA